MSKDLIYTQNKFWTTFFGQSKEGKEAEQEIAKKMNGLPKILNIHLDSTLKQLKDAGLIVGKAKKPTQKDMDKIFKEMEALGL
jgi:hypothetical protein